MDDEVTTLCRTPVLLNLLAHYVGPSQEERDVWQDRVPEIEDVRPEELAKLHGLLLAGDWIEQNTGSVLGLRGRVVPACYRATAGGRRALRQARACLERGGDPDSD